MAPNVRPPIERLVHNTLCIAITLSTTACAEHKYYRAAEIHSIEKNAAIVVIRPTPAAQNDPKLAFHARSVTTSSILECLKFAQPGLDATDVGSLFPTSDAMGRFAETLGSFMSKTGGVFFRKGRKTGASYTTVGVAFVVLQQSRDHLSCMYMKGKGGGPLNFTIVIERPTAATQFALSPSDDSP